jgi:hypothetical protein
MSRRIVIPFILLLVTIGCSKPKQSAVPPSQPSTIKVDVAGGGPATITTSTAEFRVLPSGYIQSTLLSNKLSLDEPAVGAPTDSDYVVADKKEIRFVLEFDKARVADAVGKLGRGKRVEIPAHPLGPSGTNLQRTLYLEAYDDFPNVLLSTVEYKNTGEADISLEKTVAQRHRLSAKLVDAKAKPYDLWSYQGSSYNWGEDDILQMRKPLSHPNIMGEMVKGGYGGGIPVVAFWSAKVGTAIGHVETLPLPVSLPVKVDSDDRVDTALEIPAATLLKAGDKYSTPRSFVAVYSGDFYEPLRLWSSVLQKEGWEIPKPSSEAYNVSWCGWGYEFNVTPAQMVGTIPKLKELGIKWATLDDRWFDTYGDWDPRSDTFPGDSIKKMVDDFYTPPRCYNPAHHHKSPDDSINAMADVYKIIFQTTRSLKPYSVTQSCPCGTPPSLAWLPFMDQAVTADPVGGIQVRRRIKAYKALLGPESAVYGDHVELSIMKRAGNSWNEIGDDFASTIGPGGVVGTKFVWPDPGPHFQKVALTPDKDAKWKKWITIYNEKMLSKGKFLDLYVTGYDTPEGYAIEKDGKMYYAFFADSFKGNVELRSLSSGTYKVVDYANGKDFGTVNVSDGKAQLPVDFKEHLLLEVSK